MRVVLLLAVLFTAGCSEGRDVTIRRDTWGVPHVFAETLPDGAYGLGYAQAEDRLAQIYANYRLAIGRTAEIDGPSAVEADWEQRLAGNEEVCRRRYPELPAAVRAYCEAYQDGVRAYLAEHPEAHPANELAMEPWMIAAVGRLLIFNWPLGAARHKLGLREQVHLFSNQWAVRPERTADGAAILLIDPHVPWDGPFRCHEFRLHAGGQDLSGFAPLGTPFIALGHNARLGWACTTGGPDTTDVYVEQVDPANPRRYRYDDGWREMTAAPVTIKVNGAAPVVRDLERSHHGPIALRENGKAYAVACPYLDQIDLMTQLYGMMTARNLDEFNTAVALCQLMEQNIMYADVDGHIEYIRNGRVPIRPPGFDFTKPVPGNTSRSEWLGIHPFKDLVRFVDPPTGYMQNCNVGPDVLAKGLAFDYDAYPPYLYNCGRLQHTSRSRRAIELLEAHPKLTIEEATAIALDTHAEGCEAWQALLRDALKGQVPSARGVDAAVLRKAAETLVAWDGRMDADRVGATLYRAWRMSAADEKVAPGDLTPPNPEHRDALLGAFAAGVAWLVQHRGRADVPYGEMLRVRRGPHDWPVSGGDSGGGSTLRAVSGTLEGNTWFGHAGQNWTQLVQFKPGAVRSWSATPYGESDDPHSPHYADQAERLFSAGRLKDTWFQPAELEGHVEGTTVLKR